LLRNDLPQRVVKEPGGVVMSADQLGGYTSRRPGNTLFEHAIDLSRPEFAIL
jgi:hypothetical protein